MHYSEIFQSSIKSGLSGSAAMIFQVSSLMWLRTTMNYQYKNGGAMISTLKLLHKEGGVRRLYRGYPFALMQGPLARFGDTAMNKLSNEIFKDQNVMVRTGGGTIGASLWRICIMPIDTFKSNLQIHGKNGIKSVKQKVLKSGPGVLWHGSLASIGSSMMGHYPWFFTYNYLSETLPKKGGKSDLVRSMGIGFTSGALSDIVSNSVRVIKINKQTSDSSISYKESIRNVVKKDGMIGLFTRGLKTKLLLNGIQSSIFVLIYDLLNKNTRL